MSQSEQKGANQLTRLCNMYLGGNLGKCLIFRLPLRAVDIIILPRFGSFHLKPIFTGIKVSQSESMLILELVRGLQTIRCLGLRVVKM